MTCYKKRGNGTMDDASKGQNVFKQEDAEEAELPGHRSECRNCDRREGNDA